MSSNLTAPTILLRFDYSSQNVQVISKLSGPPCADADWKLLAQQNRALQDFRPDLTRRHVLRGDTANSTESRRGLICAHGRMLKEESAEGM